MSKQIQIALNDQTAAMVVRESEALGVSPEEYANQILTKQALRDRLYRAEEEGGEYTIEEVFDPLIAEYSS